MRNFKPNSLLNAFLYISLFMVSVPVVILLLWTFTGRWPWPNLLPKIYSFRAIKEVFAPHTGLFQVLFSSMLLSLSVAILSVIIGTMTARALTLYDFAGKKLIALLGIAPNLVPGTVFAMGVHIVFIHMSLADTVLGVIIVHLIYTLPYSVHYEDEQSVGIVWRCRPCFRGIALQIICLYHSAIACTGNKNKYRHGVYYLIQPIFHHLINRWRKN